MGAPAAARRLYAVLGGPWPRTGLPIVALLGVAGIAGCLDAVLGLSGTNPKPVGAF